MTTTAITTRELLDYVLSLDCPAQYKEKASAMLLALDKKNLSRSSKPSKVQIENEPIKAKILELLENSAVPMLAVDIASALEISVNKVNGICGRLEELDKTKVKVPKRGELTAYALKKDE